MPLQPLEPTPIPVHAPAAEGDAALAAEARHTHAYTHSQKRQHKHTKPSANIKCVWLYVVRMCVIQSLPLEPTPIHVLAPAAEGDVYCFMFIC